MSYLPKKTDEDFPFKTLPIEQPLEQRLKIEDELADLFLETPPLQKDLFDLPKLPLTKTEQTKVFLIFLKELTEESEKIDIVLYESKLFLNNSVSFAQYVFKTSRLITLIGEDHNLDFNITKDNEISIASYCALAVTKNTNCRVMLELGTEKGEDPTTIHSSAIQSVYAELKKIKKENEIIYFDKRSYFLTRYIQEIIYNGGWKLKWVEEEGLSKKEIHAQINTNRREIFTNYLEPFKTKKIELDIKKYDSQTWGFLSDIYSYLNTFYDFIEKKLFFILLPPILKQKIPEPPEIKTYLMQFWSSVTDYHIFACILSNEFKDVNEYIIIAGNNHIINLCNNLDRYVEKYKELVRLNKQFGTSINLHQTATL